MSKKQYDFKPFDKVRVKMFKKRPKGWNRRGLMDHLMGSVVTVCEAPFDFPIAGKVAIYDEKLDRPWFVRFDEIELVEPATKVAKGIKIIRDGRKVIATDMASGKKAIAKCHPSDEFDFKTGIELAISRLFEKENESKQKYKVGDMVRIKTWEEMEKEFGLDCDGDIKTIPCYVTTMREFCGGVFQITRVVENSVQLNEDYFSYYFPFDSIECKVDETKEEKFEDGYTYIFNREKLKQLNIESAWIRECDGKPVVVLDEGHGCISSNIINPRWCDKYKEIKRPAKPGEYIKLINNYNPMVNKLEEGDILKVFSVGCKSWQAYYELGPFANYVCRNEYVVLDGYKPKKEELYNGKIIFTKGDECFKTGHVYEIKDGKIENPINGRFLCGNVPFKDIDDVKDYFTSRSERKRKIGWSTCTLEFIEVLDD